MDLIAAFDAIDSAVDALARINPEHQQIDDLRTVMPRLKVAQSKLDEIAEVPLAGVRSATESWRARSDEDRDHDIAESQRARRYLRLTGQPDAMTRIEGLLDPESAAIVRTSLDAIMSESTFDDSKRTRDQRCADAFTQLAKASSKGKIAGGRSNAKILATVPFETIVERGRERGVTHAGPTLDPDALRRMACDAGIHRVITGPGSSILDFGHETRLVSENLSTPPQHRLPAPMSPGGGSGDPPVVVELRADSIGGYRLFDPARGQSELPRTSHAASDKVGP